MVKFMFLKYIDNEEKWNEYLNYKLFSLYSYRKEKRLFSDFIENKKYMDICTKIRNGTYSFSIPNKVFINKGNSSKKRVVYKFLDDEVIILKYISYLLYDYDYLFSNNLYSFRKNITMKDAIYKIKDLLKDKKMYAYKVDISNYFNSIDTDILLCKLKNDITDSDLYNIIYDVIGNDKALYNNEVIFGKKGILAGCPISAFLANYYLKDMDKYFYENDIHYFRYSDDIIIFNKNKNNLYKYQKYIKNTLSNLKLCINNEKERFYELDSSIDFLGFSFLNDKIDISKNSIHKAKTRIKRSSRYLRRRIMKNEISIEEGISLMIKNINKKFYGNKREELSWKYWFFPIINDINGLAEVDHYFQEEIRYLVSGKHNKRNYKLVPYELLKKYGYKSLVHEYYSFLNNEKLD